MSEKMPLQSVRIICKFKSFNCKLLTKCTHKMEMRRTQRSQWFLFCFCFFFSFALYIYTFLVNCYSLFSISFSHRFFSARTWFNFDRIYIFICIMMISQWPFFYSSCIWRIYFCFVFFLTRVLIHVGRFICLSIGPLLKFSNLPFDCSFSLHSRFSHSKREEEEKKEILNGK